MAYAPLTVSLNVFAMLYYIIMRDFFSERYPVLQRCHFKTTFELAKTSPPQGYITSNPYRLGNNWAKWIVRSVRSVRPTHNGAIFVNYNAFYKCNTSHNMICSNDAIVQDFDEPKVYSTPLETKSVKVLFTKYFTHIVNSFMNFFNFEYVFPVKI